MREWQSQSHVKWYCRYHVVFTPKYRKRAIFGSLRKGIGKILRELCEQEKVELVEGHALSDHVHLCLSALVKNLVLKWAPFFRSPLSGTVRGNLCVSMPQNAQRSCAVADEVFIASRSDG